MMVSKRYHWEGCNPPTHYSSGNRIPKKLRETYEKGKEEADEGRTLID